MIITVLSSFVLHNGVVITEESEWVAVHIATPSLTHSLRRCVAVVRRIVVVAAVATIVTIVRATTTVTAAAAVVVVVVVVVGGIIVAVG